jgi:hypothetical protein
LKIQRADNSRAGWICYENEINSLVISESSHSLHNVYVDKLLGNYHLAWKYFGYVLCVIEQALENVEDMIASV